MKKFINISNHPSECWSENQIRAAGELGEIEDIPFPDVNPEADDKEVAEMAEEFVKEITRRFPEPSETTLHIQGEMTFLYSALKLLTAKGYACVASTTKRESHLTEDGRIIKEFKFVRFRKY